MRLLKLGHLAPHISLAYRNPKRLILRRFLPHRECLHRKPALAFVRAPRYTPARMRKYLDIALTLAVTLTLTVAMLWPLEAPPPAPKGSDKLIHFIAFAALAFPLAHTGRFGLLSVFIGASAFGGAIELIQPIFNRSAQLSDWVADSLGAFSGIGLALAYRRVRRHRT